MRCRHLFQALARMAAQTMSLSTREGGGRRKERAKMTARGQARLGAPDSGMRGQWCPRLDVQWRNYGSGAMLIRHQRNRMRQAARLSDRAAIDDASCKNTMKMQLKLHRGCLAAKASFFLSHLQPARSISNYLFGIGLRQGHFCLWLAREQSTDYFSRPRHSTQLQLYTNSQYTHIWHVHCKLNVYVVELGL